jgi:hypothetical protein
MTDPVIKPEYRERAKELLGLTAQIGFVDIVAAALQDTEARVESRVRLEQTQDAWAVAALDAWASKDQSCRSWTVGCEDEHGVFGLAIHNGLGPALAGTGSTPALARLAAARALRAADETLGPPCPGAKEEVSDG